MNRKQLRRSWILAAALAVTGASLSGCSSSSSGNGVEITQTSENEETAQNNSSEEETTNENAGEENGKDETTENTENTDGKETESVEAENTHTIQVTKIEGNKITGIEGTISGMQAPGGNMPGGDAPNGEAPQKPEGDAPSGEAPNGDAPNGEAPQKPEGDAPSGEAPNGDAPNGEAPQMPDGNQPGAMGGPSSFTEGTEEYSFEITDDTKITVEFLQGSQEGTIDNIAEGAVLVVEEDENGNVIEVTVKNLSAGGGFGGSETVTNGTSANTISENSSIEKESYVSSGDDENALRIDGAEVSLKNITLNKESGDSSNTENGDFYGQNAGLLALNGANVTIEDSDFTTDAVNGNAVFSYGEDTVVNIKNSTIHTSARNSGGIQTTGGATMNAENLTVQTEGNSAAAIRSDRGGGNVTVKGGTYTTNGTGSPAIYSTANIYVSDADLTANASEGIVVEGKNSVALKNCNLTGNMTGIGQNDDAENIHGIMIYQSMSGDADMGNASFSAEGGKLETKAGDLFYVTNTDCTISLNNVETVLCNDVFLRVAGNESSRGWGTKGANGGDVVMECTDQMINGNILVDEISSLNLTLNGVSQFVGAVNPDGQEGEVSVTLSEDSTWKLTADSYITELNGSMSNVDLNGYHLYVNGAEAQ